MEVSFEGYTGETSADEISAGLAAIAQRDFAAPAEQPPGAPAEPPAAPVAPEPPAAPAAPAAQEPVTPPAQPAPAEPQPPATPDWRNAIKDVDVAEILKGKGVDEKVAKLFDLYAKTGDLASYFKAHSVNWDEVSDTDLLRMQTQEKYKTLGLTDKEIERMCKHELGKYKLDESIHSEDEVEEGRTLLKADVAAYRAEQKKNQAEAIIPQRDIAAEVKAQQDAQAAKTKETIDGFVKEIRGSEAMKGVTATKMLGLKVGDTNFNIDVDPAYIDKYLTDTDTYAGAFIGADGKPDYAKQVLVAAFANNPQAFIDKIAGHVTKSNNKQMVTEMGNETPPANATPAAGGEKLTPAQILLQSGKVDF